MAIRVHKLRYTNQWLCVTNRETIFIACDTDAESSSSHPLERVKLLTVNET